MMKSIFRCDLTRRFQARNYHKGHSFHNLLFQETVKDSLDFVQRLKISTVLSAHEGCVNTICWNYGGDAILSGSDDLNLALTNPFSEQKTQCIHTEHQNNIFSARYFAAPNEHMVVSCSGDGMVCTNNLQTDATLGIYKCHYGTSYEVLPIPADGNTFLTCGEDGTVRWFDIRLKSRCSRHHCTEDLLINCNRAVTAIDINPLATYYVAVGCSDAYVRIFDRRYLNLGSGDDGPSLDKTTSSVYGFCAPSLQKRPHRITSLKYDQFGSEILVSYSSDNVYLFNLFGATNGDLHERLTYKAEQEAVERRKKEESQSSQPSDNLNDNVEDAPSSSQDATPSKSVFPIKRLRLRGDWSDTGPSARPESQADEAEDSERARRGLMMERMSAILCRMIDHAARSIHETHSSSSGSSSETETSPNDRDGSTANDEMSESQSSVQSNSQGQESPSKPQRASVSSIDCKRKHSLGEYESAEENSKGSIKNDNAVDDIDEPMETVTFAQKVISDSQNTQVCSTESTSLAIDEGSTSSNRDESILVVDEANREITKENLTTLPIIDLELNTHGTTASTIDVKSETSRSVTQQEKISNENEEQFNMEIDRCDDDDEATDEVAQNENKMNEKETEDTEIKGDHEEQSCHSKFDRWAAAHTLQNFFRKRIKNYSIDEDNSAGYFKPKVKQYYTGHRNARTMIKEANFWGDDYVLCGSDCGRTFIWNRHTGQLVQLLEADQHVVNCVQPHPSFPILATSGIDYNIKIWEPCSESSTYNEIDASRVMDLNKKMLEETRDTVTVPASFMLRMLASINRIRTGRERQHDTDEENIRPNNDQ